MLMVAFSAVSLALAAASTTFAVGSPKPVTAPRPLAQEAVA